MPKFGISRSDYSYDSQKMIIAKGLASVKYIGTAVADELYNLSQENTYKYFIDLLADVNEKTNLDSRQLDILIKLDFFSDFGNQRELMRIKELYEDLYKRGDAKQIRKDRVDGTPLEPIIVKYAVGVTKSGSAAKNYTLLDIDSIMHESEDAVKLSGLQDLSDIEKIRNCADIMGYIGYSSGKEEDRRKLYILDILPLKRKKDGKQFGYSIITKSIGSGKESRFSVFNKVYNKNPIQRGDIIFCSGFERDGEFFVLTDYYKIYS